MTNENLRRQNLDTDGDGLSDGREISLGTNPLEYNAFLDTDADRISDQDEISVGTNPLEARSRTYDHIRNISMKKEALGPGFYALLGVAALATSGVTYKGLPMNTPNQKGGVALAGTAGLASLGYSVYETICRKSGR
ncbi:MAG: hypothetical protein AABW91_04570 [Nanoarchaeota archaeon]